MAPLPSKRGVSGGTPRTPQNGVLRMGSGVPTLTGAKPTVHIFSVLRVKIGDFGYLEIGPERPFSGGVEISLLDAPKRAHPGTTSRGVFLINQALKRMERNTQKVCRKR